MRNFVNVVIPPLSAALTYSLPDEIEKEVEVGVQVAVPLGRRWARGYVVSRFDESLLLPQNKDFEIKAVSVNERLACCFNKRQLEFFQWIADYYGESLSTVIDVAIPLIAPQKFSRRATISELGKKTEVRGLVQKQLLEWLRSSSGSLSTEEIVQKFPHAGPILKKLQQAGLIELTQSEILFDSESSEDAPLWAKASVELDQHQHQAVSALCTAIDSASYRPFVLHGVTGSGKTEVYIEAIRHAVAQGKSALVIVPEIALTPQLLDRFRARLGKNLAVLHSALNRRSRWDSWRALLEGRAQVAIGARSGIFAPFENLGLIIVDEEHESSYKQSDGLRYNARDLALVRAKLEKCSVVLGSATPSLETFANAHNGRYELLRLPGRHSSGSKLDISVVDMNKVKPWEMASKSISPQLANALQNTITRGEQAFLLYNRRGFASYLQCESCETVLECPNCSVTLTYHKRNNELQCHYCNLRMTAGVYCSSCAPQKDSNEPPKLVHRGAGTERVHEELETLLPGVSIARLDRDTVLDEASYRQVLADVRSGKIQLLVGTQMIAKGHDLPGVTLVGIVDCDVGLHMPDFRAGERVFQLLTQASGRAGRGDKLGNVILQTRVPRHVSIVKTREQDYQGFAEFELATRKNLKYPPFARMLRIVVSAVDSTLAADCIREIRAKVHQAVQTEKLDIKILGPSPAPMAKIKTLWRWHMILIQLEP